MLSKGMTETRSTACMSLRCNASPKAVAARLHQQAPPHMPITLLDRRALGAESTYAKYTIRSHILHIRGSKGPWVLYPVTDRGAPVRGRKERGPTGASQASLRTEKFRFSLLINVVPKRRLCMDVAVTPDDRAARFVRQEHSCHFISLVVRALTMARGSLAASHASGVILGSPPDGVLLPHSVDPAPDGSAS
jgi:hypothetical protein